MERNRATRRIKDREWAKKRENYSGHKCSNPKCGICSPHKKIGGNGKDVKKYKYRDLDNQDL